MNYKVEVTDHFKKEVKKLIKKYASLSEEIARLGEELTHNPTLGKSLGNHVYKIRLSIKSKGKSGGARVITFIRISGETVCF